ncbi:MAG: TRAP transporter substrate-binding protein [Fusobacteriaceae bacterium]
MKKLLGILLTVASIGLTGCGSKGPSSSEKTLKLAHNLTEDHPVHKAMVKFGENLEKESNGTLKVKIFPNGILGGEREAMEQLQSGALDMTKVSAGTLENFEQSYQVLSLPYIFDSETKFREVMAGDIADKLYATSEGKGFVGITYYTSGARSFYIKNKPILTPDDLKGMKIRVMDNKTAIRMVELMGGAPTPLPYGEIYTALQQGVIDGSENNETALTIGKHGEVAKVFSKDEHTIIPDILIMSEKTLNGLSVEQKKLVKKVAKESTDYQLELWDAEIQSAIKESQDRQKVTFYEIDKKPFQEKTAILIKEAKENPLLADLVIGIQQAQK